MQGGGTMAAGNIRDLWMPLLCLILLFASVIYGASASCFDRPGSLLEVRSLAQLPT